MAVGFEFFICGFFEGFAEVPGQSHPPEAVVIVEELEIFVIYSRRQI